MTNRYHLFRGLTSLQALAMASIPLFILAALVFGGVLKPSLTARLIFVVVMVWGVALSVLWWRRLDEVGREAHKFAWFWGGSLAAGPGLILAMVAPFVPAVTEFVDSFAAARGMSPAGVGVAFGAMFLAVVQLAGYSLVWGSLVGPSATAGHRRMKNRIRVLRAERRWTQADLASRLGVSRNSVIAIENERYDPSLPLAFRIGEVFGLPIEEIFLRD